MTGEHFSGSERSDTPSKQPDAPRRTSEEITAAAAERQAEQAAIKKAEAANQRVEWPPKAEAELLAQLDEFDAAPDAAADDTDSGLLDDMLDDLDEDTEISVDEDLDDLFGDFEGDAETETVDPEARTAELEAWIMAELPDCRPADVAAGLCFDYEQSILTLDPGYDIKSDPAIEDDLIRKLGISENTAQADALENIVTEPEETASQVALTEEAQNDNLETAKQAKNLEDLTPLYNEKLAELGQTKALEFLLTQTDAPEIKAQIAGILSTLRKISAVVPEGQQEAIASVIKATPFNLAGASIVDQFGPVLAAIDSDPTVPAETKAAIREVIESEHYIKRGSEVRDAAQQTRINPETGQPEPIYTADSPRSIRPGVSAYSETGDEVLVRLDLPGHPAVTREVTGWSDDDIGLLTEAMGFAAGLEEYGVTGFIEDIYKIDFNLLGDSAFDRDSLRDIRQMISAMVGSFEGYDGDIFDVREKIGLIRHQARLLSDEDTAYGTENSREDTMRSARKLGLRNEDGELNFAVLKEFGRYAQETYLSEDATHADLYARLYRLFPEFVEAPEVEEAAAA